MSYKETTECFCVLWPVAPHYHPNPREHKTKADPIGYAATSFYQVRMGSYQQENWVSTCYPPCSPQTPWMPCMTGMLAHFCCPSCLPKEELPAALPDAEIQQPALCTKDLQHTLRLLILHILHLMWQVGPLNGSSASPLKQPPKQSQLITGTASVSYHSKQAPPSPCLHKPYTLQTACFPQHTISRLDLEKNL